MISVSNSFKKAIKSDERECKGYVEIITKNYVDKEKFSIGSSTSNIAEITTYNQINDNKRVAHKYASFEKNYFLLDGSFILPSLGENLNAGYISDSVSYEEDDKHYNGELSNLEIKIISSIEKCEGITLYFDDEIYPTNLYYYQNNKKIELKNDSSVLNIFDTIIFENGSLSIYFTRLNNSGRRLRITEIDLGITNIYKNNDLIEFSVIDEIDILSTSTPIGECDVTINDKGNKFDLLNTDKFVEMLNGNVQIIPYFGIVTEDIGVQYTKNGIFFFENYTKNNDTTVTINAKNILNKLTKEKFRCLFEFKNYTNNTFPTILNEEYFKWMIESSYWLYKFKYEFDDWFNLMMTYIQDEMLIDFFRAVALIQQTFLTISDDNEIYFKKLSESIVDVLMFTELKEKPIFEKTDAINVVEQVTHRTKQSEIATTETFEHIIQNTYEDNYEADYLTIFSDYAYSGTFSQVGASNVGVCARGLHLATLKIIGVKGETVKINLNGTTKYEDSKSNLYAYKDNAVPENKTTLTIDNAVCNVSQLSLKRISDFVFSHSFDYSVSINYNGDPSLKCGDKILVQTDYGMKEVVITKHELKFDGSLSGSIKGVGN